jgi:predicted phage terminase large subunit-like protein
MLSQTIADREYLALLEERRRREDLARDREELDARYASLANFVRDGWHVLEPATDLKWGWALDAICEHLEAVSTGQIRRLLMNVPPGSMKSLLTGVFFPAWEWGPLGLAHMRYLGTAHKEPLATRDNVKCRRLIQSRWYQDRWPIRLTGDQNAKTKFENVSTGFRESMSFTGMTGSRGNRVLLDDPHSVDDANSATVLAGDLVTFNEALPSRVADDDSAIVIIMQRLNERDVSARALELGYEHLCIPMRWETDREPPIKTTSIGWSDPRTKDGELMFPERFPEKHVVELETSLGSYAAAGQLQQRPAPRTGGMFQRRWFEIVEAAPAHLYCARAWDLAGTVPAPGKDPDWTVGAKMGRCRDGFFWILDVNRSRESAHKVEKNIKNTASQDGKSCRIRLPEDPGQAGKSQAQTLIRKLAGYVVRAVKPTGSKEVRATPFSAQAEAGNVKVLKAAWNEDFFQELEVFPFAKHDDQVDAASDAFDELSNNSSGFLEMVQEENAQARDVAEAKEAEATAEAANDDGCPFPKGSVEWLRHHGLMN